MFTTAASPTVVTLNATLIENTSVTLNGKVTANMSSSVVTFEYEKDGTSGYISVPAIPSPVSGRE
jgi:hypothetical protein